MRSARSKDIFIKTLEWPYKAIAKTITVWPFLFNKAIVITRAIISGTILSRTSIASGSSSGFYSGKMNHSLRFKTIALAITCLFLINNLSWAYDYELKVLNASSNIAHVKQIDINKFEIPFKLGSIKERYVGKNGKIIIHIQDAHCNYYAQHKINDIIEYLNKEYGIKTVNLEGGKGDYDLSIFTDIYNRNIREKITDYFVKEGMVNGAEYFAINNPNKVTLWGVEDSKLYLEALNVYRDSLKYKETIDKYLDQLNHIISNLRRHIYSKELLEFDEQYSKHKKEEIEFKDYLAYLIQQAELQEISIESFTNINLLKQAIKQEETIDFKRANEERKNLIEKFQKLFSKKEFEEIALKSIDFKFERISQNNFYEYLVERAKSINIDLKESSELAKYITYISTYETMDKFKVMEEVNALGDKIKNALYKNDVQKELSKLSKNLILQNNIFNFTLTPNDYKYCKDNTFSFYTRNYISFIDKQAPLYNISAKLDKNINVLDQHLKSVSKFYEYAFKRDVAFLENIKFTQRSLRPFYREPQVTILITGGFHAESLSRLLKENNISYISILPSFKIKDGYKCPYFNILSGGMSPFEKSISTTLSLMQVASFLNDLGIEVNDPRRIELLRIRVIALRSMYTTEVRQGFRLDNGKYVIFDRNNGNPTCFVTDKPGDAIILAENVIAGNANSIIHAFSEIGQDRIIREAKDRTYLHDDSTVIAETRRMLDSMPDSREQDTLKSALENLLKRTSYIDGSGQTQSPEGYSAIQIVEGLLAPHPGGQGIYLPKTDETGRVYSVKDHAIRLIHELSAGIYAGTKDGLFDSHELATAIEDSIRVDDMDGIRHLLSIVDAYPIPIWDMSPQERLEINRDFSMTESNIFWGKLFNPGTIRHRIAKFMLMHAVKAAKEKEHYNKLDERLNGYHYEEDVRSLLFDEDNLVRTIALRHIVKISLPDKFHNLDMGSIRNGALKRLCRIAYYNEGTLFLKEEFKALRTFFCDENDTIDVNEIFSNSEMCILLSAVSRWDPETVNILFKNQVFLDNIEQGNPEFMDSLEYFLAPAISRLELEVVEALVEHPRFAEIINNRPYGWSLLQCTNRLLSKVTPAVAKTLLNHPLFDYIIDLDRHMESAEHLALSVLSLCLPRIAQVREGMIVLKTEYNGLNQFFCDQDGKLVLIDLIKDGRKLRVFQALSKISPKTLKTILELRIPIADIIHDDNLSKGFVIVAANLDNWYKNSPAITKEIMLLSNNAIDFMIMFHVFDFVKFNKASTIEQFIAYLNKSKEDSNKIASFQTVLYLFSIFCNNGLILEESTDELLVDLFTREKPASICNWLTERITDNIKLSLVNKGISVDTKNWQDILLKAAVFNDFQGREWDQINLDVELNKVERIINHLGTESENVLHYMLNLCYAINLRYFSDQVINEFPKGFAHKHDFTTDDVWNNAHANLDEQKGTFSIGGSIFALPSELSHVIRFIFEKNIFKLDIERKSRVTEEVADRIGIMAIMQNPRFLTRGYARSFVYTIINFSRAVIRDELMNLEVRSAVLRELRRLQDAYRYDRSRELVNAGEIDKLLKHLRPQEIYWVGRRLYEVALPYKKTETETLKRQANELSSKFTQGELDNVIGIMPLSTTGVFSLQETELRPYEEYARENLFSDHLRAESLCQDFIVHLIVSIGGTSVNVSVLPYLTAKAFEHICTKMCQSKIYEEDFITELIGSISPEDVKKWNQEMVDEEILRRKDVKETKTLIPEGQRHIGKRNRKIPLAKANQEALTQSLSMQRDTIRQSEDRLQVDRNVSATHDILIEKLEKIVKELIDGGLILDQNSVYERLISELTEEEIFLKLSSDYHLFEDPDDKFRNYDLAKYMIDKVSQSLGKTFVNLLADPSISNRLDEFISFALPIVRLKPSIELLELRKKFRESLDKRTVYRVALMKQNQLEEIRRNGFIAALNKRGTYEGLQGSSKLTPLDIVHDNILNLRMHISRHTRDAFMINSGLISVSNYPRMAAYATRAYLGTEEIRKKIKEGYKIYLFPIEIYEFDLIRHGWYIDFMGSLGDNYEDETEKISCCDTGNEAVVQFRISPEQILFSNIKILNLEDMPEYEISPPENQDRISNLTPKAHDYIREYFKQRVPFWGKYNEAGERFVHFSTLGLVSLFSIPDLEKQTGQAVWIGKTTDHPNPTWANHDSPLGKRQSVFVDAHYAYDRAFIITNIEDLSSATEIVTKDSVGRESRTSPIATAKANQSTLTQSLSRQRDSVRQPEERDVLAVVVINDEERLKDIDGMGKVNMTGLNVMAERMVSRRRNSRVVYVKTIEEANAKMADEGRTWANTFFFVEDRIAGKEQAAYDSLKRQAFIWNLNIPDNSLCSVTPFGFLVFSLKFNDFLTRIQEGSPDLDMEPLAEIILHNIGEDVTPENIRRIIKNMLKPIAINFSEFKNPQKLLSTYSGHFSWNLPRIEPKDWSEVDDYFDALDKIYSAA
ncbi:MAG: hypothetical protein JSV93_01600 [Candidatus Omnitrophota bacterium]|nr:MAG: hypothetical protein JSV93_01600 [Candidatus Omnitrophota bacterium]